MRLIDAVVVEERLWDARRAYQLMDNSQDADKIMHGIYNAEQIIREATTVDAVPVVHATLEDMGIVEDDREWVCSNCKAEFTVCVCGKDRTWYIKHCPYCGAMIIGERKGGDE